MTTIENLKQLESEVKDLSKSYSGTLAATWLNEEATSITKVLKFLEEKEERFKVLYYKNLLKENIHLLTPREIRELENNWVSSEGMIKWCDKYNIDYNIIDFHL